MRVRKHIPLIIVAIVGFVMVVAVWFASRERSIPFTLTCATFAFYWLLSSESFVDYYEHKIEKEEVK